MAFVYEPLNLILMLAFSTCFLSQAISIAKPQRLVTKLIHPASVNHPYYNPNETAKGRMELDIQHSASRLAYIQARIEASLASNNNYKSNLSPSLTGRTILANLSIGQPPIHQLVIMDTASEVFWVMCTPCSNCHKYPNVIFDPSKSSTYSPLCKTPGGFRGCKCNISDQYTFSVTYDDNFFSQGTLGHDMLVFETIDEGTTKISNVVFGCGHNIGYTLDQGYNGILGLNNGSYSLVSQIGQKFSYCIGNLDDKYYNYNQLILGEGADLEGYSTRFEVHHGLYYVTMEGISVGEKRLDIAPSNFEINENDGTGGVIIDTGMPLTYLSNDVHKLLYNEVRNLLGPSFARVRHPNSPWLLCYFGSISRDLVGFPVVTFHFAGGAELALDSTSFFHRVTDDIFCMTIAPNSEIGVSNKPSVIGLLAQQSYSVGYDLVNQFIYLQRIDCELLN